MQSCIMVTQQATEANRRAQQCHCELDSPREDLLNKKSVKPMQKWTPTPQSLSFETCRALLSDFTTNNKLCYDKRPFEQAGNDLQV